jgi:hypothetical protein
MTEMSWRKKSANALAEIVVAVYVILDGIVRTLLRPLTRWLNKLNLIRGLEEAIGRLPPYGVLFLLIVPFAGAEPAKIYGIYLIGSGHKLVGLSTLAAAYFVSVVVVDRIFHAGKAPLLTIPWFARLWFWISAYKDRLFAWMKSTAIWQKAQDFKSRVRTWVTQTRWG